MPRPSVRLDPQAAELRLVIRADAREELFAEAARVVARRCGRTQGDAGPWERVELRAPDRGALLVDWINEMIGRSEVSHRAFDEVRFTRLDDGAIVAEVRGRPVPAFASPLKAATLHGVRVEPLHGRWEAEVLLDV